MMRLGFVTELCLAVLFCIPSTTVAAQEIKPFVRGSYQQIISARQGKPFVVNFWSLSCGYCMVELDMFKKLAGKYPKLDLVLVSTDTPDEEKALSAALVKMASRKTETWVFADSFSERLRFEVDKKWQGELPRTYFFDAKGKVNAISGKVEQKEVEQWIKEQYSTH